MVVRGDDIPDELRAHRGCSCIRPTIFSHPVIHASARHQRGARAVYAERTRHSSCCHRLDDHRRWRGTPISHLSGPKLGTACAVQVLSVYFGPHDSPTEVGASKLDEYLLRPTFLTLFGICCAWMLAALVISRRLFRQTVAPMESEGPRLEDKPLAAQRVALINLVALSSLFGQSCGLLYLAGKAVMQARLSDARSVSCRHTVHICIVQHGYL